LAVTVTLAEARLAEAKPALEAFLAEAAGAGSAEVQDARPLSGGAIQENWLLEVDFDGGPEAGRQEFVLRTDSPSSVSVSLSRVQEFAVLRAAWQAGVCVPEPLWLDRDAGVLGKPFYVMRRVRGTALGHEIVRNLDLGGDRAALAERLGEELAKIHGITPPRADLPFLEMPRGAAAPHAVIRYRKHLDALGAPQPALEWGLRWCELHAPPAGETVLVHQDFRTGNYLVDGQGLTAVLDWEFAAWGDPMSDLGWFCAKCWRFGRNDLEAGGIAAREPFYRGYERVSGRRVDHAAVAYWEVVAHLRWAVIALQQGARSTSGQEPSLELSLIGRVRPPELAFEVLNLTPPARWEAA
jgi:aminoglycoside phosphotransferase (APT) family kinase protein